VKAAVVAVSVVIVLALAGALSGSRSASADGGPHVKGQGATTDSCAGCHRAHTGQAANGLLAATEVQLCYTCHDGSQSTTNVVLGSQTQAGGGGALKGGGFSAARIMTADDSVDPYTGDGIIRPLPAGQAQAVTSAHSVDGTPQKIWGNGSPGSGSGFAGFQLTCTSCHDPHGNGNYRILRPNPASDGGAPAEAAPVNVPDLHQPYTTSNYLDRGPVFVTPVQKRGMPALSAWCSQCHTRYLTSTASARTAAAGDSIFTFRHTTYYVGAPSCVSCHAAHGTNAMMTGYAAQVEWPNAGGEGTPSVSSSRLLKMDNRGICLKCHPR
jgi:predicted CXXCH cytochrome family protein